MAVPPAPPRRGAAPVVQSPPGRGQGWVGCRNVHGEGCLERVGVAFEQALQGFPLSPILRRGEREKTRRGQQSLVLSSILLTIHQGEILYTIRQPLARGEFSPSHPSHSGVDSSNAESGAQTALSARTYGRGRSSFLCRKLCQHEGGD